MIAVNFPIFPLFFFQTIKITTAHIKQTIYQITDKIEKYFKNVATVILLLLFIKL